MQGHSHEQNHHQEHRGTLGRISGELIAHAPFSVSSVAIGLVLAGLIGVMVPPSAEPPPEQTAEPETGRHYTADSESGASHGSDDADHDHGGFSRLLFHLFLHL